MTRFCIALAAIAFAGTAPFNGTATAATSTTIRAIPTNTATTIDKGAYNTGLDLCLCLESGHYSTNNPLD